MAIILRKTISDVKIQQAVDSRENLPTKDNEPRDTRYVKKENNYYIFNGSNWQEMELIIN